MTDDSLNNEYGQKRVGEDKTVQWEKCARESLNVLEEVYNNGKKNSNF